jgi:hypothetical protein
MYLYSEDKRWIIGCIESGQTIYFTTPIPAWSVAE